MSRFITKEILNKKEWENYLIAQNPGTFLQSWNWGETNKLAGFGIKRFGFYEGKTLVGIAQLIYQPAKRGYHILIPGGPVIDYENYRLLQFVADSIKKFAQESRVWFVRVRPDVPDSDELRKMFSGLGFISAPMHVHGEHTLIMDISKNDEEILKGMRKTTRYLIRKSLNEGFKIRISRNAKDAGILFSLQGETVKRHRFVGFTKKLFEGEITTFGKDGQSELFICEKRGIPMVAAIIIYYGEKAFYHHSGSLDASRSTNASYFTQWQVIKRARELGKKYYDFWGIAPSDDPKHRFAGVTIFKKGFGGERIDWFHAHDIPVSRKYWITYVFETLRRITRHL